MIDPVINAIAYSGEVGHPFRWKWARRRRASRRGKDIMTEVAHLGQVQSGGRSSSRLHHFVSIVSFPLSDSADVGHHSGEVGHPGMVACHQPPAEPVRLLDRLIHSRSSVMALRRM